MATPTPLQISPEDLAKVHRTRAKVESSKISPEWLFVARFGKHYGWQGVMAIINNEIDFDTASTLLKGAEKVHAGQIVDIANAHYAASIASKSGKKGAAVFKKSMSGYTKEARVG